RGLAAAVVLPPDVAVAVDLRIEADGQRVHDGGAHAVQTAGDRVAASAELAAGVQDRQHDLQRGDALRGVHRDGDAAAVVDDAHAPVLEDRHLDVGRIPGHGLVDGVVDDLLHQVVQAALRRGADVHAGPLAHRLETFEDGDVPRFVMRCLLG